MAEPMLTGEAETLNAEAAGEAAGAPGVDLHIAENASNGTRKDSEAGSIVVDPFRRQDAMNGAREQQPVGMLLAAQSLLYVLAISLFVITFLMQPIRIPSGSMEPTLLVGDFLLMNKQAVAPAGRNRGWSPLPPGEIRRGEVVVFHDPVDDPSVHLVKRVVGMPGDRIHLREGVVYVNGEAMREPYAVHRAAPENEFRDDFPNLNTMDSEVNTNWWIRLRGLVHEGEITVPRGSYFVMGDNRNNSEDSRYWGFVPRDAIVGEPFLIYFSFRRPGGDEGGDRAGDGWWRIVRWGGCFGWCGR